MDAVVDAGGDVVRVLSRGNILEVVSEGVLEETEVTSAAGMVDATDAAEIVMADVTVVIGTPSTFTTTKTDKRISRGGLCRTSRPLFSRRRRPPHRCWEFPGQLMSHFVSITMEKFVIAEPQ
jgi:hypothetical protein